MLASRASEEDAEGLERLILLAEGAQVMITRNLWTSKGLVNGARGTVKKIWYNPSANPLRDLPAVVFVEVPGYTGFYFILFLGIYFTKICITIAGPDLSEWPGINPRWVPIVPVTARWENKIGSQFARTQFPLTLAWAITIHKSQGLTLEKAVIELGPNDLLWD